MSGAVRRQPQALVIGPAPKDFMSKLDLIAFIKAADGKLTQKELCKALGQSEVTTGAAYRSIGKLCRIYRLETARDAHGRPKRQ